MYYLGQVKESLMRDHLVGGVSLRSQVIWLISDTKSLGNPEDHESEMKELAKLSSRGIRLARKVLELSEPDQKISGLLKVIQENLATSEEIFLLVNSESPPTRESAELVKKLGLLVLNRLAGHLASLLAYQNGISIASFRGTPEEYIQVLTGWRNAIRGNFQP